jgi:hypothetical protein
MSDNFSFATAASAAARALDGAVSRVVHDLVTPAPHRGEEWHRAVAQFRGVREQTISMVRPLSQKQVDFAPARDSWSIGQNLDHLLLSERLYRAQIERLIHMAKDGAGTNINLSLQQVNSSFAFIPREIMALFSAPMLVFNRFVPHAVRENLIRYPIIPALNPTVSDPVRGRPVAEVRDSLKSSIEETERLFRSELPGNLNEMTLSHPILGINNAEQILGILGAHEERHQGQMRAVMSHSQFPNRLDP